VVLNRSPEPGSSNDSLNTPNMIIPPEQYRPERVDPATLGRWLSWSLGFFSGPELQNPYLDVTLQLDITEAYARYSSLRESGGKGTFFAYLIWHLGRSLKFSPSFNLRRAGDEWYLLHNPPVFSPVAVGGSRRFSEIVIDDLYNLDYTAFIELYLEKLSIARRPDGESGKSVEVYNYAHFIGNLPNLRFTGMTLHWRPAQMQGQSFFYFGERYRSEDRLLMPLSVKLHHACTDFFVLDELIVDFRRRLAGQ
jgi:chloramphenicol O-acetyltransferase type A